MEDGKSDLASALSDPGHRKALNDDLKSLLVYPIPTEPEDEDGLTTDSEDSEWESPEKRQKRVRDRCVC